MAYRMVGALIASLGAVALMLGTNETFAASGAAPHARMASTHFRPSVNPSLRHHRRNNFGGFFPGEDGFFYDPSTGEPIVGGPPPASGGDIHYTYTYDVPWDWAHRYPPAVVPSDRPYVSGCPAETVTVRGHDGREQTINIMRCY
jgi:hypothetical protein